MSDKPQTSAADGKLPTTGKISVPGVRLLDRAYLFLGGKFFQFADQSIPVEFSSDPEHGRQARLVSRFGWLGAFFGSLYGGFYILINHLGGAGVIFLCSCCFAAAPFLLRWKKSVELAGNFLCLIMLLGFSVLSAIEGGLAGHAIA